MSTFSYWLKSIVSTLCKSTSSHSKSVNCSSI
ncbi:hypothetical protein D039_4645B, partial [Vibrio parahaemolyticus EKP-028]